MKTRIILLSVLLLLGGCATDKAYQEGKRLVDEGQMESGLGKLAEAVRDHPDRLEYRAALLRAREKYLARLLAEGDQAMKDEKFDVAEARYRDALREFPENPRAQASLAGVETARRDRALFAEAQAAFTAGDLDAAARSLRVILAHEPGYAEAAALLRKVEEKTGQSRSVESPGLAVSYQKQVTLEFRDAPLKTLLDGISQQTGLNFVLDRDVRGDQPATVLAHDTPLSEVLDSVLASNQLARKVLNGHTLLVYPNTTAKQQEYKDEVVRGFFLTNADPKQTMNLLRNIGKIRDVHVDDTLNMVVVRDSPEAVRLAEKLVRMVDRAEPEVMLDVEILEVKRSKLQELGVQWPTQFGVIPPPVTSEAINADGVKATNTTNSGILTLAGLRNLTDKDIGVSPNPYVNINATDSDVNLLANPRIRVRSREKAHIHIGDKVPVITSNVTSTGVTSESVSYLDVGLKLDVEPQVYLDTEVAIKVGLEVSNIVQQVKSATGTLTYQLGSRNANTLLRLRDGETQVLAGLISDEERASASKVPGLGDLPLLGRLFSNHGDNASKTEIVLLITPHVIRNVVVPDLPDVEFYASPDASTPPSQPGQTAPGSVGAAQVPPLINVPAVQGTSQVQ